MLKIVSKPSYVKNIKDIFQDTLSYNVYKDQDQLLETLVPNFIGQTDFQYAIVDKAFIEKSKSQAEKALEFMYECLDVFIEKDDKFLYDSIGIKNPLLMDLIKMSWDVTKLDYFPTQLTHGIYGNFDMTVDKEGKIWFYEYNGNTPVLTYESIVLQEQFIQDMNFDESSQFNALSESWQYIFKKVYENHGCLNMVFAGMPELVNDLLTLETMTYGAQQAGHKNFIADLKQDIEFDFMSNVFYKKEDNEPIDFMVNFFPWEDYDDQALKSFIANYENILDNGKGTLVAEPPFKVLLSNKAFMAFMTDYDAQRMADVGLIPTYLDRDKLKGSRCVGKPVYGRMSSNIQYFEADKLVEETEGAYSDTLFVYQPFKEMLEIENQEDYFQFRLWVAPLEYEDGEFYFGPCGFAVRKSTSDKSMNVETEEFIPHVIE